MVTRDRHISLVGLAILLGAYSLLVVFDNFQRQWRTVPCALLQVLWLVMLIFDARDQAGRRISSVGFGVMWSGCDLSQLGRAAGTCIVRRARRSICRRRIARLPDTQSSKHRIRFVPCSTGVVRICQKEIRLVVVRKPNTTPSVWPDFGSSGSGCSGRKRAWSNPARI